MTTTNPQNIVADLAEIRIESHVAEGLIRAVAGEIADDRITARLDEESDFLLVGIRMAHDILVTTTMAQTLASDAPFNELVASRPFCGDDEDLQAIGHALVDKIAAQPRLPDADISDTVLSARYKAIHGAF